MAWLCFRQFCMEYIGIQKDQLITSLGPRTALYLCYKTTIFYMFRFFSVYFVSFPMPGASLNWIAPIYVICWDANYSSYQTGVGKKITESSQKQPSWSILFQRGATEWLDSGHSSNQRQLTSFQQRKKNGFRTGSSLPPAPGWRDASVKSCWFHHSVRSNKGLYR